jgi:Phage gp6-like head-tail connector protein
MNMIDSLSDVKQLLNISGTADDALLAQLQPVADAVIEEYCGRTFTGGTFTELFSGKDRTLFLKNYPIASVTSVKVATVLRDAGTYTVFADRGVIVSRGRSFGDDDTNSVEVVYTTANAVPVSLGRAYADLISDWYRQAKTAAHLGQLNLISRNETGIETRYSNGSSRLTIPKNVLDVLEIYRVPTV